MRHIKCIEHFISGTYNNANLPQNIWILRCLLIFLLISRYLSQKKYSDLLSLLYKGSMLLLQRDQQGSGADLALLLVDVLTKSETKPCEEWFDKIAKLFELINSNIPEREAFLTNSVKWSMDNNKKGHPILHKVIILLLSKDYIYIVQVCYLNRHLENF